MRWLRTTTKSLAWRLPAEGARFASLKASSTISSSTGSALKTLMLVLPSIASETSKSHSSLLYPHQVLSILSALAPSVKMSDSRDAKVTCELVLGFPSKEHASKVFETVESDNEGYVDAHLDGHNMVAVIQAESLNSLLHTLDDFLSCVSVAEKVISGRD